MLSSDINNTNMGIGWLGEQRDGVSKWFPPIQKIPIISLKSHYQHA